MQRFSNLKYGTGPRKQFVGKTTLAEEYFSNLPSSYRRYRVGRQRGLLTLLSLRQRRTNLGVLV